MKVVLREVEDADVDVFEAHQREPDGVAMAGVPTRAPDAFRAHWALIRADPGNVLRTVVVDGVVVGNIVSWQQDGERLVGYWFGRAHWGRGIASRALGQYLRVVAQRPLTAHVAEHNAGSARVLRKSGFVQTGDVFVLGEDRARGFAELHRSGCFLLPNAWDVGSAKVLRAAGFPAVATTSAGIAFSLGLPDHAGRAAGRVDRDTMLQRVREIAGGVDLPVSADLEDGYGATPEEVADTVTAAVVAGAVGGNIEDFADGPLLDQGLAVERIQAARAAAGGGFTLVGRTDGLLAGGTVRECVTRANAYLAAGADCAFVPGASDAATIAALVSGIDGPLNVVLGLTGTPLTFAEVAALGVRRVTVGGSLARALLGRLVKAATELTHGTFGYTADQLPHEEVNALFGPATP